MLQVTLMMNECRHANDSLQRENGFILACVRHFCIAFLMNSTVDITTCTCRLTLPPHRLHGKNSVEHRRLTFSQFMLMVAGR